jgi:hypothetical protein
MGIYGNNTKGGQRLAEIRGVIEDLVLPSTQGVRYVAEANARRGDRMDGRERLREVVFIAMFAGWVAKEVQVAGYKEERERSRNQR